MTPRKISRPAALRGLPLDRHAVIDASAGTGKTFTLEHLVVDVVLGGRAALEEILIVTFTERATHELRVRVRGKLEELVSGGGAEPTAEELRAGDFWTLDAAAVDRLRRALTSFDRATISTIHAFCQRVLRDQAFASGRLFVESQVDAREAFGKAFRDVLRREIAGDPARAPWLEAVLEAGMTISSLEELLWRCADSRGALRPAFDPARLDAAIAAFPVADAYQATANEGLKQLGFTGPKLAPVRKRIGAIVEACQAAGGPRDAARFVALVDGKLDYLLEQAPRAAGSASPAARVFDAALEIARAAPSLQACAANVLLPPVRAELARRKRRAGQYDFEDMLQLLADALDGGEAGALAASLRRRYRVALVDEFQDTDETQWRIFRQAFVDESFGAPSSVFLVGDPKQSIYRFRGADVQTFEAARREILGRGGSPLRLGTSFRSTEAMVGATNAIFDAAAEAPFFASTRSYEPVGCGRPERTLVDGAGAPAAPVHVLRFEGEPSMPALGALIAREILAMTRPDRPWRLGGEPIAHDDVFVLTRTGLEGRLVGDALRAAGVPHAFYKEEGLFQTDEARDVRVLLSAIDDPGDRARRVSAWMTPFFGLPVEQLDRARDVPATHPFMARLLAWKAIAETHDHERLFESIVLESRVLRRELFAGTGERRLTNLLHVLEALLERSRRERLALRDLVVLLAGLADRTRMPLDMEGNVQRLESDRRAVQIMTVHKAKGLEATVVFLAGGWSRGRGDAVRVGHEGGERIAWVGSAPAELKERMDREDREEDERLMYVALTRARARLVLPSFPPEAMKRRGATAYDAVNRRLNALADAPFVNVEAIPNRPALRAVAGGGGRAERWEPPGELLHEPRDAARFAALREARAGAWLTSYTRMKAGAGARAGWEEEAEERRARKGAREIEAAASGRTLRAARVSGVFVHEVLELAPVDAFAAALGAGGLDAWRADPRVAALVARSMAVHRIDPAERAHAEELVWRAYATPVALPGGGRLDGIARATRLVREMDFVFPVAQSRSYVQGSIDLAFEHGGLTYFVDWKTDSLEAYDAASLARHVETHYEDQLELYALATVKLLGVTCEAEHDARFGGLLYVFLRGLGPEGAGVWSARPSWPAVTAWAESLGQRARRP